MRRIKNKTLVFLTALLLTLLSGCSGLLASTDDITDFRPISILGLDAEKDGAIKLTVSAKEEAKPNGGAPESDKPLILTNTAETVSRAFGEMQMYTDKRLYLGHDRYCLVGEKMAEHGIGAALDFFERDPNARLDTKLFVVRGDTAEDLLTKASGNNSFAADRLASMEKDARKLANLGLTSVVDISNALDENGVALARSLRLVPPTAHDSSAESGKKSAEDGVPNGGGKNGERLDFDLDGYAIIKDNKLVDYMPLDDVAGYNLLNGMNYYDYLEVSAPDGEPVSLMMDSSRRTLELEWRDGVPVSLNVGIDFKTVLEETHSALGTGGLLNTLPEAQNALIMEKVRAVIDRSKKLGCDFTGIGGALRMKYPAKFSKIRNQWDEIWVSLPVEISVKSEVVSAYNMKDTEVRTA